MFLTWVEQRYNIFDQAGTKVLMPKDGPPSVQVPEAEAAKITEPRKRVSKLR